jgi:hypothetical protein
VEVVLDPSTASIAASLWTDFKRNLRKIFLEFDLMQLRGSRAGSVSWTAMDKGNRHRNSYVPQSPAIHLTIPIFRFRESSDRDYRLP